MVNKGKKVISEKFDFKKIKTWPNDTRETDNITIVAKKNHFLDFVKLNFCVYFFTP